MIYSLQGKLLYHLQCLNDGVTLQSVPLQQKYTTLDMMSRCEVNFHFLLVYKLNPSWQYWLLLVGKVGFGRI